MLGNSPSRSGLKAQRANPGLQFLSDFLENSLYVTTVDRVVEPFIREFYTAFNQRPTLAQLDDLAYLYVLYCTELALVKFARGIAEEPAQGTEPNFLVLVRNYDTIRQWWSDLKKHHQQSAVQYQTPAVARRSRAVARNLFSYDAVKARFLQFTQAYPGYFKNKTCSPSWAFSVLDTMRYSLSRQAMLGVAQKTVEAWQSPDAAIPCIPAVTDHQYWEGTSKKLIFEDEATSAAAASVASSTLTPFRSISPITMPRKAAAKPESLQSPWLTPPRKPKERNPVHTV